MYTCKYRWHVLLILTVTNATHPVVRWGASHWQNHKSDSNKSLIFGPRWGFALRLTGWMTISYNMTLTSVLTCKIVNIDVLLTMSMVNDRPVLSPERTPHIDKTATDSNMKPVLGPRWGSTPRLTGQLPVNHNVNWTIHKRCLCGTWNSSCPTGRRYLYLCNR
jgi:hypothetical protein